MSRYAWNIAEVTSVSVDSLPAQHSSQHRIFLPWLRRLELCSASADTDIAAYYNLTALQAKMARGHHSTAVWVGVCVYLSL